MSAAAMYKPHTPKTVKEIASQLADGESTREVCPFCNGGRTHESSFHMTRKGTTALYICYRASCPIRGRFTYGGVPYQGSSNKTAVHTPIKREERFPGEYKKLTVEYLQYMKLNYDIQPALLKEYWVKQTEDGRFLFPVLRPDLTERGHNVRAYSDVGNPASTKYMPKAMLYLPEDEIALSWHRLSLEEAQPGVWNRNELAIPQFFPKILILVEDQVSAIKASRLVDSVSLMGTNLSLPKINEISREVIRAKSYKKILILLDADAYRQAIKHLRRTKALLMGVGIRRLTRDIKDMSYKEIYELLEKENPE